MSQGPATCFLAALLLATSAGTPSGPGLRPDRVTLPCRYFFIPSSGSNSSVSITGQVSGSGQDTKIRSQVFSLEEAGEGLVRYQTRATLDRIAIEVDGRRVDGAEEGREVQPHGCHCPEEDFDRWFQEYGCQAEHPQVAADLAQFDDAGIDMVRAARSARERFGGERHAGTHSYCHYSVVGNRLHRRCHGQHVGFSMFPDSVFSLLARMVRLPDTEFLINLGDWPLVGVDGDEGDGGPIPMLSWCKTNSTVDVLLPTYELTEASTECMGRQVLDMLSVQGHANLPWSEREGKAFFKGRDSSKQRLKFSKLAREHPDLLEGGITRYFFFRDREEELGSVKPSSFFDFFKYKYQISLDGTVAAYRLPFLLAGGSLVLKQDSDYYEHFYGQLRPWVHYVPVRRDLSDLVEKVRWARDHDDRAREIAGAARRFAREHLLPREVLCYHALVVREWTARLATRPAVRDGMEEVGEQDRAHEHFLCKCHQKAKAGGTDRPRGEL